MKQLYLFLLPALLFFFHGVSAQSFSTKVSAQTIGKKDILQVEYIAENLELREMILPVFNGWSILSGPNFSSNRLQTGNTVKQQVVYTITLQPEATGRLTIPGARATIDNKTRLSNSVSVEVKNVDHIQGNSPAQPPAQTPGLLDQLMQEDDINDEQVLKKGETARDKIQNNLLVVLQVSKKSVFVGEPVLATYKLCTRIRSQSRVVKQPTFSGCTVVEMTATEDPLPQKEKINGKMYNVYIIRQVQLIPLQQGTIQLGEASVENKISFYREGQFSYRDLFYSNPAVKPEEVTVTFQNKPVDVEVKNLPQPVPGGFSGAVGDFELEVTGTNQGGAAGNGNEVQITISGKGNLQQAKTPVVTWPAGLEGFEPVMKEALDKTIFPSAITRKFSYPYVASKAGSYSIAPVSFVYFNAAEKQYINLTSSPLKVNVARATRNILPADKQSFSNDFYTRLYIFLGAGLLAILFGLVLYNRQNKMLSVNAAEPQNTVKVVEEATIESSQFIHQVRELEPSANGPLFYKQLHRSLTAWLWAKYQITQAQINGFSDQHPGKKIALQKIAHVIEGCSVGMYTPLYNIEEAIQHRSSALEAINQLERSA